MNGTHRPPRRRPSPPRDDRTNAQLARLCAALGIVLLAFCMKLAFPGKTEAWLRDTLGGGIDLQESITAIGAGLRDVFQPVEGSQASLPPEPYVSPETIPSASPDPSPEPSTIPLSFPELGSSAPQNLGALTFDDQLLSVAARPVVALENGLLVTDPEEDDAPPIPFGMTVPENADYTRHDLPFDYALPLDGTQTSGYGWRMHPIDKVMKFHYGIDIGGAQGTPVLSFAAGRISAVGKNNSYGNYVLISHDEGYSTLYAHLSAVTVKTGAAVKLGGTVGKVGQTGKATGPHLHFELRGGGKLIDPTPYLA